MKKGGEMFSIKGNNNVFILYLFIFLVFLMIASCASVKNYDDKGNEIGFEHFVAKYYLYLEPLKDGGNTFKILTLPDLSSKRYVKHHRGWGSVQFSFKIRNGVLTEFGQATDSKGPETITSLASLGTAYGGILTGQAAVTTADKTLSPAEMSDFFQKASIKIDTLTKASSILENGVVKPLFGLKGNPLLNSVYETIKGNQETIKNSAEIKVDENTNIIKILSDKRKLIRKILKSDIDPANSKLKLLLENNKNEKTSSAIIQITSELGKAINLLRSFAYPETDLVLFEIAPSDSGGIEFKKVVIE